MVATALPAAAARKVLRELFGALKLFSFRFVMVVPRLVMEQRRERRLRVPQTRWSSARSTLRQGTRWVDRVGVRTNPHVESNPSSAGRQRKRGAFRSFPLGRTANLRQG